MTLTASNLESHSDDHFVDPILTSRRARSMSRGARRSDWPGPGSARTGCRWWRSSSRRCSSLMAISSPILVKIGVLDPYTFHADLLDYTTGNFPKGAGGGISIHHPLGVEPQSGRDVLSRLMLGTTLSMTIALSAAFITVAVGTTLGIIAGLHRRHRRRRHRSVHRPDPVLPQHPDAARALRGRGRPHEGHRYPERTQRRIRERPLHRHRAGHLRLATDRAADPRPGAVDPRARVRRRGAS